jgi:hypothetical protein
MSVYRKFFSFPIILLSIMSCSGTKLNSQHQGIQGIVLWFEGNQMPGFDREPDPGEGIEREIYIYELTNHNQGISVGVFYTSINTRLIAVAKSINNGEFKISLPPGHYSLLVKEESGLFANIFDMDNNINPVQVNSGQFTEVTIQVNYSAAY